MSFITIFQKYFPMDFLGFDLSALGQEMQGPNIVTKHTTLKFGWDEFGIL